jgi:hypothetical protein
MIHYEDRHVVLGMALAIYCARIQANTNLPVAARKDPDATAIAGEAVALLDRVDRHLAPEERRKRTRREEGKAGPAPALETG